MYCLIYLTNTIDCVPSIFFKKSIKPITQYTKDTKVIRNDPAYKEQRTRRVMCKSSKVKEACLSV